MLFLKYPRGRLSGVSQGSSGTLSDLLMEPALMTTTFLTINFTFVNHVCCHWRLPRRPSQAYFGIEVSSLPHCPPQKFQGNKICTFKILAASWGFLAFLDCYPSLPPLHLPPPPQKCKFHFYSRLAVSDSNKCFSCLALLLLALPRQGKNCLKYFF